MPGLYRLQTLGDSNCRVDRESVSTAVSVARHQPVSQAFDFEFGPLWIALALALDPTEFAAEANCNSPHAVRLVSTQGSWVTHTGPFLDFARTVDYSGATRIMSAAMGFVQPKMETP